MHLNSSRFYRLSIIVLLLTSVNYFTLGQTGTGLPVWVLSPVNNSGIVVVDFKVSPPEVKILTNISPVYRAATATAVNKCGEPVFYVIHSGQHNVANNLFIYDGAGNPLLNNNLPNGPGLNAKCYADEIDVFNVPGFDDEWYIIYSQWKTNSGAPLNDGTYTPSNTLFSRVKYQCHNIIVLQRDIQLDVSGTNYTYTNGKAISTMPGNPGQMVLYLARRDLSGSPLSLDRFIITSTGIDFDKNTGPIPADYWNLGIDGGAIEVSSDGLQIAFNNRDASTNGDEFILFDAIQFNNDPANYQSISINDLILQPDNIVLFSAAPVGDVAASNSSLRFLVNMPSKMYDIEFSPNGEYLYFISGGFAQGGTTNATYLGQIDLGTTSNRASYPYNLRLQIQSPPGNFNPNTGTGGPESQYPDTYHQLRYIQKAYNDSLYFIKRNDPYLYIIPFPDEIMPQCLIPSEIDLADPQHQNIQIIGKSWGLPDGIDGYNYISSVNPAISLGNDATICQGDLLPLTPGSQFESYCWQDGSSEPVYYVTEAGTYWVEVIDQFGCIANDTVNITLSDESTSISLGGDQSICPGDSVLLTPGDVFTQYLWQDGSTGPQYLVKDSGTYWVEVLTQSGCTGFDSVLITYNPIPNLNLGSDQLICQGDSILLDPGSGFSGYLWQNGYQGRSLSISDSGLFWVEVTNNYGCNARDSVYISLALKPDLDLGPDTIVTNEDTYELDAGPGFISYFWQDGSWDRYFEVKENGYYWVTVENQDCESSDTVYVILNDCIAHLYIPNCFTPNDDGYNDRFIVSAQNLTDFTMLIFNRWGQMLLETNDIDSGWDGKVNGNICPVGTYYYLIKYSTPCSLGIEKSGEKAGSVTLLK